MIEDLKTIKKLLEKAGGAHCIEAHNALLKAKAMVRDLIPRVREFEDAHRFLAEQHKRRIF